MTRTTMSEPALPYGLGRDPSQPVGLPCPECGHRPALRFGSYSDPRWACGDCRAEFTMRDVLRYLWNRNTADLAGK